MNDKALKDLNLHVMEAQDVNMTSGGTLIEFSTSLLKKVTPVGFAIFVIDNWEDVKKGLSDGWNAR